MNVGPPAILYEDGDVLALDKPAGLLVHPARAHALGEGKGKEPALTDWLIERFPELKGVGERMKLGAPASGATETETEIERPGIVHRLDRETSGVIIVAKTPAAHAALKRQFQAREAEKVYRAFVWGRVKEDTGVIDRPIGRNVRYPARFSAERHLRGRERDAVTQYRTLARGRECSFLELRPKTGRTHQIRVHLKAIGHPVVCDRIYAPKRPPALGFERLALHARSLTITLPDGARRTFEAPYPEDFKEALRRLDAEGAC